MRSEIKEPQMKLNYIKNEIEKFESENYAKDDRTIMILNTGSQNNFGISSGSCENVKDF